MCILLPLAWNQNSVEHPWEIYPPFGGSSFVILLPFKYCMERNELIISKAIKIATG